MTMTPSVAPPPPVGTSPAPTLSRLDAGETSPPAPAGRAGRSSAPPPIAPKRKSRGERVADGIDRLVGRLRDALEALRDPASSQWVHEFADAVTLARDPEHLEASLVSLAGAVGDASRVELLLDRDVAAQPAPTLLALWPKDAEAMTADQVEALGYPLCLGLWCGDHYQMTLQVFAKPGRGGRWPRKIVRRLTTLCAMAAAAERGMHVGRRARFESAAEKGTSVRDATFLSAILPYALSQAQRHREALTVFCLELDHLAAVTDEHGWERVDAAVRRVSEAMARTLRGSDVVVRLDDDRLVVVLPNTGSGDALTVANVVKLAVTAACLPVGVLPELTFGMGVSCFPEDGHEMSALLNAADNAMTGGRNLGKNQVSTASAIPKAKPAAGVLVDG